MKRDIIIKDYDSTRGLQLSWEEGFVIQTKLEGSEIVISANSAGLMSLANHLLNLAQNTVPIGSHIHLDEYNSLEDGSVDIILEKIESSGAMVD